jgi:predicted DCC family thiol-disulfide oxidoreductase YuxK
VLRWDHGRRLRPVEIQAPEAQALLAPVDPDARLRSWHLSTPTGEVLSAGAAFPELFSLLPGAAPLGALARGAPGATQRAYLLVAGNRSTLGRLVTAGAKRRADALIAARSGPLTGRQTEIT